MSIVKHSPKLRALKLNEVKPLFLKKLFGFCGFLSVTSLIFSTCQMIYPQRHDCSIGEEKFHWDEPSSVPETLMFELETLEWRNYRGWNREKELAKFILKHSYGLKRASFSPVVTTLKKKRRMLTELALLSRGSMVCQLVFD